MKSLLKKLYKVLGRSMLCKIDLGSPRLTDPSSLSKQYAQVFSTRGQVPLPRRGFLLPQAFLLVARAGAV